MTRNLSKGLNKLFLSQLFVFTADAAGAISYTCTSAAVMNAGGKITLSNIGLFTGFGVLGLAAFILAASGMILQLAGLWQCGKDDKRFKHLLYVTLLFGTVTLVMSICGMNTTGIVNLFQQGLGLLSLIFAVNDLKRAGRLEMADRGEKVLRVFIAMCSISLLLNGIVFFNLFGAIVVLPIALLSGILSIYYLIACIRFFGESAKALA